MSPVDCRRLLAGAAGVAVVWAGLGGWGLVRWQARRAAVRADEGRVLELVRASAGPPVRRVADGEFAELLALAGRLPDASVPLTAAADRGDPIRRRVGAILLAQAGVTAHLPRLKELAAAGYPDERRTAAHAVDVLEGRATIPRLMPREAADAPH